MQGNTPWHSGTPLDTMGPPWHNGTPLGIVGPPSYNRTSLGTMGPPRYTRTPLGTVGHTWHNGTHLGTIGHTTGHPLAQWDPLDTMGAGTPPGAAGVGDATAGPASPWRRLLINLIRIDPADYPKHVLLRIKS